jgi:hypothetical protein
VLSIDKLLTRLRPVEKDNLYQYPKHNKVLQQPKGQRQEMQPLENQTTPNGKLCGWMVSMAWSFHFILNSARLVAIKSRTIFAVDSSVNSHQA